MSNRLHNAEQRATYIIESLLKNYYVSVTDLSSELGVTEATIRKDLSVLEVQGLLRRTHGGATHVRELTHDIVDFYQNRTITRIAEKQLIGRAAFHEMQERQVIAFSSGSTPLQIAREVPPDYEFTAITNDLSIVRVLSRHEKVDVFVPGGYLRLDRDTLVGASAVTALQDFTIDVVFITVTALDLEQGATAGHISNVVYLRELIARTKRCIVVADHTKFQNPPQIVICGWRKIDLLITDSGLAPDVRQQLAARGVEMAVV